MVSARHHSHYASQQQQQQQQGHGQRLQASRTPQHHGPDGHLVHRFPANVVVAAAAAAAETMAGSRVDPGRPQSRGFGGEQDMNRLVDYQSRTLQHYSSPDGHGHHQQRPSKFPSPQIAHPHPATPVSAYPPGFRPPSRRAPHPPSTSPAAPPPSAAPDGHLEHYHHPQLPHPHPSPSAQPSPFLHSAPLPNAHALISASNGGHAHAVHHRPHVPAHHHGPTGGHSGHGRSLSSSGLTAPGSNASLGMSLFPTPGHPTGAPPSHLHGSTPQPTPSSSSPPVTAMREDGDLHGENVRAAVHDASGVRRSSKLLDGSMGPTGGNGSALPLEPNATTLGGSSAAVATPAGHALVAGSLSESPLPTSSGVVYIGHSLPRTRTLSHSRSAHSLGQAGVGMMMSNPNGSPSGHPVQHSTPAHQAHPYNSTHQLSPASMATPNGSLSNTSFHSADLSTTSTGTGQSSGAMSARSTSPAGSVASSITSVSGRGVGSGVIGGLPASAGSSPRFKGGYDGAKVDTSTDMLPSPATGASGLPGPSSRASSPSTSSSFNGPSAVSLASQAAQAAAAAAAIAAGVVPPKRKTKLLNIDRKRICDHHMRNPKHRQDDIAVMFGIERSTVSKILKQKEKWLRIEEEGESAKVAKHRTAKFPEIERKLLSWVEETRAQNLPITDIAIKTKALAFAREEGLGVDKFKASGGWIEKFRERNQIRRGAAGLAAAGKTANPSSAPPPPEQKGERTPSGSEVGAIAHSGRSTQGVGASSSSLVAPVDMTVETQVVHFSDRMDGIENLGPSNDLVPMDMTPPPPPPPPSGSQGATMHVGGGAHPPAHQPQAPLTSAGGVAVHHRPQGVVSPRKRNYSQSESMSDSLSPLGSGLAHMGFGAPSQPYDMDDGDGRSRNSTTPLGSPLQPGPPWLYGSALAELANGGNDRQGHGMPKKRRGSVRGDGAHYHHQRNSSAHERTYFAAAAGGPHTPKTRPRGESLHHPRPPSFFCPSGLERQGDMPSSTSTQPSRPSTGMGNGGGPSSHVFDGAATQSLHATMFENFSSSLSRTASGNLAPNAGEEAIRLMQSMPGVSQTQTQTQTQTAGGGGGGGGPMMDHSRASSRSSRCTQDSGARARLDATIPRSPSTSTSRSRSPMPSNEESQVTVEQACAAVETILGFLEKQPDGFLPTKHYVVFGQLHGQLKEMKTRIEREELRRDDEVA